jgi:hypothetical protein
MPELIDSADVVALPLTGTEELIIGILLCDRPVLDTWVESLNALRSPLRRGTIAVRSAGRDKLREIQAARTGITERALKVGARWLFFLDDDVLVAPNTLEELLAAMRSNPRARIMGGIYGGVVCPHLDARLETSDFKGRDPWTVRYFNGRYVDQAGNVLRKSQLGGSI